MNNSEFEKITGLRLDERDGHPYYGGSLYLRGTGITSLPEGLTVGGSLYLENCTGITSLPEGLTVGGSLYLRGTGITSLPEIKKELSIKSPSKIREVKNATNVLTWKWNGNEYIKVDGMFSVLESKRNNIFITHPIGKHKQIYIVTDGEGHYAHGNSIKEARKDLIYKINDRDTSAYKNLSLDDTLSFEEAIAAYRTITGACSAGTRNYIENRLPKPHKECYTIREIIELTEGEYNSSVFAQFFSK